MKILLSVKYQPIQCFREEGNNNYGVFDIIFPLIKKKWLIDTNFFTIVYSSKHVHFKCIWYVDVHIYVDAYMCVCVRVYVYRGLRLIWNAFCDHPVPSVLKQGPSPNPEPADRPAHSRNPCFRRSLMLS